MNTLRRNVLTGSSHGYAMVIKNTPLKNIPIPSLGELEIQVLEYLWTTPEATVKQVHAHCGRARAVSLNTVQSAMERLHRKGLLARRKKSHSYRYAPLVDKETLVASLINDVVGRFQVNSQSSAAAMLDAALHIDDNALDLLEQEIRKRRSGASS